MNLDCCIVHAPKFQNSYPSLGNYTSTQLMALGIFALADAVAKGGHPTRILHLGIEKALDPRFTLGRYLRENPARVVAFSVQFHQQLHDSLRAAQSVKRLDPAPFVVLGGLTAGFFHKDILAQFPAVDAVVVGEAETALRLLVDAVARGERDFSQVPNLAWRKGGEIVANPVTYTAGQEELDALDFTNLPLMEHHRQYVDMPKVFTRLKLPPALRWKVSRFISRRSRRIFYALSVGRGCVTNCSYCGGGLNAQRLINCRPRPTFRSPERVAADIRALRGYGFHGAYVSFDPQPLSEPYYLRLFEMVRRDGTEFDLPFACWGLPSRAFVEAYAKTFSPHSFLLISPETGAERLRGRTRGYKFSNAELLESLAAADANGVQVHLYFSLGIPGETRADFEETLRLRDRIRAQYPAMKTFAFSVEIEPAAPWHLTPEEYGITLTRRTLQDFLREQRSPAYSSMTSLGYHQDRYLDEPVAGTEDYARRVLRTKCLHFCDQRSLCRAATPVWKTVRLLGLDRCDDTPL